MVMNKVILEDSSITIVIDNEDNKNKSVVVVGLYHILVFVLFLNDMI